MLASFLEKSKTSIINLPDSPVSAILEDGYAVDKWGNKYIKFSDRYIKSHSYVNNIRYIITEADKKIFFTYKEGKFHTLSSLEYSPEFSSVPVGIEKYESLHNSKAYIEKSCADEIIEHGLDMTPSTYSRIAPGIYANEIGSFFSYKNNLYKAAWENDNILVIYSKNKSAQDIRLIKIGKYYLRLRERDKETEYLALESGCRVKRSPDEAMGTCPVFYLSKKADEILQRNLKYCNDFKNREKDLTFFEIFPNVFQHKETRKIYFRYKEGYFKAAFIPAGSGIMMPDSDLLRVYYNNIFNIEREIVTLTHNSIKNYGFISTLQDDIRLSTEMTLSEAEQFIHNYGYVHLPYFRHLEQVIAEVNEKGYVPDLSLPMTGLIDVSFEAFKEDIKEEFYSESDGFHLVALSDVRNTDPLYIRGGKIFAESYIKRANIMIDFSIARLKQGQPFVKKYLMSVLNTKNDYIIRSFAELLVKKLTKIKINFKESTVYMMAEKRKPVATDYVQIDMLRDADTLLSTPEMQQYFFKPPGLDGKRVNSVLGFVPANDKNARLVINMDRMYEADPSKITYLSKGGKRFFPLEDVLIHEASHLYELCRDIDYISIEHENSIPVLDAIDELTENIKTQNLVDKDYLFALSEHYFNMMPEYSAFDIKKDLLQDSELIANIFKYDVIFKSHILLSISELSPFSSEI